MHVKIKFQVKKASGRGFSETHIFKQIVVIHIFFTKTQKLSLSDRLSRPSAVYEVKTVVCYIK